MKKQKKLKKFVFDPNEKYVFEWYTPMDYGPWTSRVTIWGNEITVEAGYGDDRGWNGQATYKFEGVPTKMEFPDHYDDTWGLDPSSFNDHSSEFAESLGLPRKAVRLAYATPL